MVEPIACSLNTMHEGVESTVTLVAHSNSNPFPGGETLRTASMNWTNGTLSFDEINLEVRRGKGSDQWFVFELDDKTSKPIGVTPVKKWINATGVVRYDRSSLALSFRIRLTTQ